MASGLPNPIHAAVPRPAQAVGTTETTLSWIASDGAQHAAQLDDAGFAQELRGEPYQTSANGAGSSCCW